MTAVAHRRQRRPACRRPRSCRRRSRAPITEPSAPTSLRRSSHVATSVGIERRGRERTPRRRRASSRRPGARHPRRARSTRTRRRRSDRFDSARRRGAAPPGRASRCMIRRQASRPSSKVAKPYGRALLAPGLRGAARASLRVMTPSVPSEPTKSCIRSGPTAWRGARPPSSTTSPLASTTLRPRTMSSILP